MAEQKPSVGRIVRFVDGEVIRPAIVLNVHSESCVDLKVFAGGGDHYRTSVVRAQEPEGRRDHTWHWPERD